MAPMTVSQVHAELNVMVWSRSAPAPAPSSPTAPAPRARPAPIAESWCRDIDELLDKAEVRGLRRGGPHATEACIAWRFMLGLRSRHRQVSSAASLRGRRPVAMPS